MPMIYTASASLSLKQYHRAVCRTGLVAQLIASLTAFRSSGSDFDPAQSHTFVENDHETISLIIHLLPHIQNKKVCESRCTKYWLTAMSILPRKETVFR